MTTPSSQHDAEGVHEDETPNQRLRKLGRLSPIGRLLPRSIVLVGTGILVLGVVIILIASLVSNQAAALIEFWINRITNGV